MCLFNLAQPRAHDRTPVCGGTHVKKMINNILNTGGEL